LKGFGAVVTGTSISGQIKVGDDVCLYPSKRQAKIRGIQVHGQEVSEVEAGHRTAINLQGLEQEFVSRGDILATPGCLIPSPLFDVDFLYLSSNAKPLKNRARVRVHIGTAEIMARLALLDREAAAPGERANAQLLLEEPLAAWPGDHYVVRSYSPVRTIGGGLVLNNCPGRKRRRFKETNQEIFDRYRQGDPEALAVFHLNESGVAGLTGGELEVRLGLFGRRLKKVLERPVSRGQILVADSERQWLVGQAVMEDLKQEALAILERFHREQPLLAGIGKEELRSRLAREGLDPKLFQMLLATIVKAGAVAQEQALVRLAGHRVALREDEATVRQGLAELLKKTALAPPVKKELAAELGFSQALVFTVLDLMARDRQVVRISEDLYYDQAVLTAFQERLTAWLAQEGEIDAQGFKALSGLSRKYSIPLMEYFDKLKLTIRVGDKRVLRGR
ncbi:MAG: SelB C-terminal domain-containing protein, partial [Desulfobacteraceae bacterium]|nr:SelB C-terminal domain-containing protein [Desulfobacteraceae bacterium]